mgnify:CR=1 FL=1
MKAYFIAILTLFTCIATVVRAQQMSELENRIDSLLNGKKATVAFGMLKTAVDISRLTPTLSRPNSGARKASFLSSSTTDLLRDRQLKFKPEIDVRGMRVDEATQAITYFIDDALQFNTARVRILHGTGTGALRQTIRQYLSTVSGVIDYHDEDVRLGGAGITVVDLEH